MAVAKMTVKQLRAELSLRNQETRGNKAELVRALKKARAAADDGAAAVSEPADSKKKIDVIVSNVTWNAGTVMQRRSEESKVDANDEEEADVVEDEANVGDDGDEPFLSMDDSDDEDTFEYDDRVSSIMRLRNFTPRRGDDDVDVGDPVQCALGLANKAKMAGFRPTSHDIEFLSRLEGAEDHAGALADLEKLVS
jgi:hypothetical protein